MVIILEIYSYGYVKSTVFLFEALIFIVLCSLVRQIASNPSLESTTQCKASQHSTCSDAYISQPLIYQLISVEQDGEPAGGHFESQWLNPVDVICVVANDPSHARLSDLVQLGQGERPSLVHAEVMEELVPFLQPGKLVPDDTLEYWAKD